MVSGSLNTGLPRVAALDQPAPRLTLLIFWLALKRIKIRVRYQPREEPGETLRAANYG
jgi:hypothetical protein